MTKEQVDKFLKGLGEIRATLDKIPAAMDRFSQALEKAKLDLPKERDAKPIACKWCGKTGETLVAIRMNLYPSVILYWLCDDCKAKQEADDKLRCARCGQVLDSYRDGVRHLSGERVCANCDGDH